MARALLDTLSPKQVLDIIDAITAAEQCVQRARADHEQLCHDMACTGSAVLGTADAADGLAVTNESVQLLAAASVNSERTKAVGALHVSP